MALLSGLNVIGSTSGYFSGAVHHHSAGTTTATALYTGQLVQISSGIVTAGAVPAASRNFGVAQGFTYVDNISKNVVEAKYVPAGLTPDSGEEINGFVGQVVVKVFEDTNALFVIKADGTTNPLEIGYYFSLANIGSGNAATGRSTCLLDASTGALTKAGKNVQLLGFLNSPDNDRTGTSPSCIVRLIPRDFRTPGTVT